MNVDDCAFIFEETWRSRSALNGTVNDRLCLVKWDPTKPCKVGNMICLTKNEAKKHMELKLEDFEGYYSSEFLEYVARRFREEAEIQKIRLI